MLLMVIFEELVLPRSRGSYDAPVLPYGGASGGDRCVVDDCGPEEEGVEADEKPGIAVKEDEEDGGGR